MVAQLRLMFDVRGDLLDAARACEQDVFDSAYGNSPQELPPSTARTTTPRCSSRSSTRRGGSRERAG